MRLGPSVTQQPKEKNHSIEDSHVVPHRGTKQAVLSLQCADRTGCRTFRVLWPWMVNAESKEYYPVLVRQVAVKAQILNVSSRIKRQLHPSLES